VQGADHPLLFSDGLHTRHVDWVAGTPPALPLRCQAKTRYRQPDQPCEVRPHADGYRVLFDRPQRAITPGQSVVFYQEDLCLGGGIIEQSLDRKALAA